VRQVELLEPEQPVHDLPHDDAQAHLGEAVRVLQLVEQLAVADLLHLDLGQRAALQALLRVVQRRVLVLREHRDQVVVQRRLVHFDFVRVHAPLAVRHCRLGFFENLDGNLLFGVPVFR